MNTPLSEEVSTYKDVALKLAKYGIIQEKFSKEVLAKINLFFIS